MNEPDEASEAEGQELRAAGCIAIHKSAKANLVGNAETGEALHHDPDHDSEHGGAAVELFCTLELIDQDQLFSAVADQLVVGGGLGHGNLGAVDGQR